MASNETVQKITLKVDESIAALNSLNASLKATLQDSNKNLTDSSKTFKQNETQIRSWSDNATAGLRKYGAAALENIKLGAQALTLDFGRSAIHHAADDAVKTAFSFSKAFAEIKSRSNASAQDLESWRKSIMQISVDTTANMDSMAESFKDMFSSVKDPKELLAIMGSIGDAAAMGDGDATKVSSQVKSSLQGQGRAINKANVDDYLGATDILRRNGNGFNNLGDAMGSMNSVSGQELQKSKLSERDLASILAGATNTGSERGASVAGIGELIKASNNHILQGSVLGSLIGNSLTDKSGKFNINSLKGGYSTLMKQNNGNENQAKEIFNATSGLQNSDAIFNLMKNFDQLSKTMNASESDTKTFGQSALEAKDNLENAYKGFDNALVKGVSDIFGGFEGPMKSLLGGHVGAAAVGTGSAINQGLEGIGRHPALVAGALATTFAGGALLKGVFGKIPGLGLAKGLAEGQIAKKMGAEPVFVVNASEIGESGGGVVGDVVGKAVSPIGALLGALGMTLGAIGLGAAAGYAGGKMVNGYLDENTTEENKYGQKSNAVERKMAQWMMSPEQYQDTYGDGGGSRSTGIQHNPNKLVVEVHSVDTTLKVVPKAGHLQKDSRTH